MADGAYQRGEMSISQRSGVISPVAKKEQRHSSPFKGSNIDNFYCFDEQIPCVEEASARGGSTCEIAQGTVYSY